MSLSEVTQGKIKNGIIKYATDKNGKGSGVLGQVALEKTLGYQISPRLIEPSEKWQKGEVRLAIGLGDLSNKADKRIYMNGDSEKSLYNKICTATGEKISKEWDSVSKALEGREKLDLSKNDGISILDAYSRCDTREEKLELIRSAYNNKDFNPMKDSISKLSIDGELKSKIENGTRTFIDREANHIKELNIGNTKVCILVSKDINAVKDMNQISRNNVLISPNTNKIIINTDGKSIVPKYVLGEIAKLMADKNVGQISVQGNSISIQTEGLKNSGLNRETIVSIIKDSIDAKSIKPSIISTEKNDYILKSSSQMVMEKIESIYGPISGWPDKATDLYLHLTVALEKNDFNNDIGQKVNVEGYGEVSAALGDNKEIVINVKLEEDYKISSRDLGALDVGDICVFSTYRAEDEVNKEVIAAINTIPQEILENIDTFVIVREDETDNKSIKSQIDKIYAEMNRGGQLEDGKTVVLYETGDRYIENILHAVDKTIESNFTKMCSSVFGGSLNDVNKYEQGIKDFVNDLKISFAQTFYDNLHIEAPRESIENADMSGFLGKFIENTIELKMNDFIADNSINPMFETIRGEISKNFDLINDIKNFDMQPDHLFNNMDSFSTIVEKAIEINSNIERLRNVIENKEETMQKPNITNIDPNQNFDIP